MATIPTDNSPMLLDDLRAVLKANVERLVGGRRAAENRQAFAKRIGIGDGTLGRLIGETANPRLSTLVKLAKLLRVEPWQLLAPVGADAPAASARPALPDPEILARAIRIAEDAIAQAGATHLSPAKRARIVNAAYRLYAEGVGVESAKGLVADILATITSGDVTQIGESAHATRGPSPRRTRAPHKD